MALYKGFSTIDYNSGYSKSGVFPSKNIQKVQSPLTLQYPEAVVGTNTFILTDVHLVERNLLNHIYTQTGSCVMMPNFGTIIPLLVFEQLDGDIIDKCRSELEKVIAYDPRVSLISLKMTPNYDNNYLTATIRLNYIELNITKDMELSIEFGQ